MVTVILAEPEHPGNVGSVARVMKNFGLAKLILIDPKCDHKCQEARNLAKHAQEVLANARVTSWEVLKEFRIVAGTTGVVGTDYNLPRTPLLPEEACAKIVQAKDAALLFGRESDGLRNNELARCDLVVTIPTNKRFPSMNLSHAVAVMLYTLSRQKPVKRFAPVRTVERDLLLRRWSALIDALPMKSEPMRSTQRKLWKNVFGRAMMTRREAFAAFGFVSALERSLQPRPRRKAPTNAKLSRPPARRGQELH